MINLTANDFAQDGAAAGISFINYRLDDNATSTVSGAAATVAVSGKGKHALAFFAVDKLGNKEKAESIGFTINEIKPVITELSAPGDFAFGFGQKVSACRVLGASTKRLSFDEIAAEIEKIKEIIARLAAQIDAWHHPANAIKVA